MPSDSNYKYFIFIWTDIQSVTISNIAKQQTSEEIEPPKSWRYIFLSGN